MASVGLRGPGASGRPRATPPRPPRGRSTRPPCGLGPVLARGPSWGPGRPGARRITPFHGAFARTGPAPRGAPGHPPRGLSGVARPGPHFVLSAQNKCVNTTISGGPHCCRAADDPYHARFNAACRHDLTVMCDRLATDHDIFSIHSRSLPKQDAMRCVGNGDGVPYCLCDLLLCVCDALVFVPVI